MRKGIDITGQRFGRLVALEWVQSDKPGAYWKFKCDCGTAKVIKGQSVREGIVVSCGCRQKETLNAGRYVHGFYGHPLFATWRGIVSRCTNRNDKDWPSYGGRGISVCDDWLASPEVFFKDMGEKPRRATLDRIDVNGNYEKGNCRWATPLVQGSNKRNNSYFVINGQTLHFAEICRQYNLPESTLSNRLKAGLPIERAVSKPRRGYKLSFTHNGETRSIVEWASTFNVSPKTIKNRIASGRAIDGMGAV